MWPGLQAVASKYQDKPVLFLAVNSGSARPLLQAYLRKNRIRWPAIADQDRSFEKSCGVPMISLKNICQVRILKPDGKLVATSATRLETSLTSALAKAKWNVDPTGIPAGLRTAWFQVEFGNFAQAAVAIKKAANSRKTETKQAGTKLRDHVTGKMTAQLEAAKKAEADGKTWEAYRGYSNATVRYKGYGLPKDLSTTVRRLAVDPAVKQEVSGLKILAAARRKLGGKSVSGRKSGLRTLQRLADKQPDSQAGQEAQRLLDQFNSP
ncbi:MAG: hypothetical protein QF363_14720 [Planctomycetaceae bacterium]|jgi:hypothetical protein|nr:hypothetical protein [Planctomycetaceae bacterium]